MATFQNFRQDGQREWLWISEHRARVADFFAKSEAEKLLKHKGYSDRNTGEIWVKEYKNGTKKYAVYGVNGHAVAVMIGFVSAEVACSTIYRFRNEIGEFSKC